MSRLMSLYAQHLGAAAPRALGDGAALEAAVARAAELLREAGAVVVGVGSGMSSACGYDHYHPIAEFGQGGSFERFRRAHGFETLMDGYYHLYATNEERWAFTAAYIDYMESAPVGRAYRQLASLLTSRDHVVLTTNVDGQVRRAFPDARTWLFQGDFAFLQCSQPCCVELWPAGPYVKEMLDAMGEDGVSVPSELLPRCPRCGWLMAPWVRDEAFLEGSLWQAQRRRYEAFVSSALKGSGRVVFLELGVGGMTPSIIELPFWDMVARHDNASLIRINTGKRAEPRHLGERSLTICADIADAMDALCAVLVIHEKGEL